MYLTQARFGIHMKIYQFTESRIILDEENSENEGRQKDCVSKHILTISMKLCLKRSEDNPIGDYVSIQEKLFKTKEEKAPIFAYSVDIQHDNIYSEDDHPHEQNVIEYGFGYYDTSKYYVDQYGIIQEKKKIKQGDFIFDYVKDVHEQCLLFGTESFITKKLTINHIYYGVKFPLDSMKKQVMLCKVNEKYQVTDFKQITIDISEPIINI